MCAQGKAWVRRRAKRIVGGRKKKQGGLGLVAASMIGSHVDKVRKAGDSDYSRSTSEGRYYYENGISVSGIAPKDG